MNEYVLVINPGSTSTKVALFCQSTKVIEKTIRHSKEELDQFDELMDQITYRKMLINKFLEANLNDLKELVGIVARGGLIKPVSGGTYQISDAMLKDLRTCKYGTHASNLGAIIANDIAKVYKVQAYIVDPVVVDELEGIARVSGVEGIERRSVTHALNQRAVAREKIQDFNKTYENSNIIVAHMGGGISLGAHYHGRMIDMINGIDGEGPFSPERSGDLPLLPFAEYILKEEMSFSQVKKWLVGHAGVNSYLNEIDIRIVEEAIDCGDLKAQLILEAMAYQVSKAIGQMAVTLKGQVDLIVLTGGIAYSEKITQFIKDCTAWIAPVTIYAGEKEMEALYEGFSRVYEGHEEAKRY